MEGHRLRCAYSKEQVTVCFMYIMKNSVKCKLPLVNLWYTSHGQVIKLYKVDGCVCVNVCMFVYRGIVNLYMYILHINQRTTGSLLHK